MNDIISLSASQLSQAIHSKQVSCVQVMDAYLAHIAQHNPSYNAIVSVQDGDDLRAQARIKDLLLAQGRSQGWLHGMPQAPKDLTATAGIATTMGFRGLAKQVPSQDSVMAARMRAAGAIFIGKTNTPEFGLGSHTYNALFGATGNAYNPQYCAGGSSGGTAVAIATHMLPVADGSDMMGSLRNPAVWNNIYGLRPSLGRVPYGAVGAHNSVQGDVFFQQLGTEGPMGRTVADLAQLLAIQSGYDARVPLSLHTVRADFMGSLDCDLKGKKIAWLGDFGGYLPVEHAVTQLLDKALPYFGTIGCTVDAAQLQVDYARVWQAWLTLRGLTVAGNLSALYANPQMRALLKPEAVWEYEQGQRYSAADIYTASAVRSQLYAAFMRLFERFDYIALPAAQCMPFAVGQHWPKTLAGKTMDTYHRWMECTIYATLAGLPALAIPAGFDAHGLPCGMQIIGKPQSEWSLLQLGHAWEHSTTYKYVKPDKLLAKSQ